MGDHTRQSVLNGEESEWVGLSLSINKRGSALIRFTYGHLPEISLGGKKTTGVYCNYKPKKANNLKSPNSLAQCSSNLNMPQISWRAR